MTIFDKIFPEETDIDRKKLRILTVCYQNGWNLSQSARVLGVSRKTMGKILSELRESPIYQKFCEEITAKLGDFYDRSFVTTLFQRYESEYERLERMIRSAEKLGNDAKVIQLTKLKHALMGVELRASLSCQAMKHEKETIEEIQKKYREIYEEALDEFGGVQ